MTSSVPVNVPVIPVQEEAPNKKVEDTIDCSVNTSSALVEKTDVDTFISQPKNMIIYPTVQQILISKKPDI